MNEDTSHRYRNLFASFTNNFVLRLLVSPLVYLGDTTISWISRFGVACLLFYSTITSIFKRPFGFSLLLKQLYTVGVHSFHIIVITGTATGMVMCMQGYYQLVDLSVEGMVGGVVSISILKELGPVLTGIVLAGRIGASITAELGTMIVTEQIDAMKAMATNPVKYIVVPRFLACTIMLPVLTMFSNVFGILGGYLTAVHIFNMNGPYFMEQARAFIFINSVFIGLIKATIFGMVIACVSCYKGFTVTLTEGAEGVGRATTGSAVTSLILILIVDFIVNHIMYTLLNFR